MFKVIFEGQGGYAAELESQPIGLVGVDKIRGDLQLPKFPLERIQPTISGLRSDPTIAVEESLAREAGLFLHQNRVTVEVPRGALNQFLREITISTKADTGEIESAHLIEELDKIELLHEWKEAGFPLEWNPDK